VQESNHLDIISSVLWMNFMRSERPAMGFDSLVYSFRKHSSPGKCLLVRCVIILILVLRLPAAIALASTLRGDSQNRWKGTGGQYLRIILSALSQPSA